MRRVRFASFLVVLLVPFAPAGCTDEIHTLKILHANVNCSDIERSKGFYEMLGFVSLSLEIMEIDVAAEPAAGLGMPPYRLRTVPITLMKGFLETGYIIDLIQWTDPYDPSPPYALANHLGLSRITVRTTDLDADMATLQAQGVVFLSAPVTTDRPVENSRLVCFRDPDGTLIELIQPGDAVPGAPNVAGTHLTAALRTSVNCSDTERSRAFYEMLGFALQGEVEETGPPELAAALGLPSYQVRAAKMTLPEGHSLNLTKWEDPYDASPPYDLLNHIGIPRFAILTSDLDADVQSLREQGVVFYADPVRPEPPYDILRFACFEDPDGTVIELVQMF